MRWMPLQNSNTRHWILSVINDDYTSYDVTTVESEHVERILSYTAFMNDGITDGIDSVTLARLSELKTKYEQHI